MRNSQNFWDKNAGRYDRFMRKDAAAYEQLYELLRPVVRQKTVLELATGTGLIAKLKELSENLPHYISLFETGLAHFWTRFDTLAQRLPKTLQVFFSSLQTDSSGFLLSLVPKGSATGKLGGVSGFFIAFFVSLISFFLRLHRKEGLPRMI